MIESSKNPAKIAKITKIYGDLCTEMCEAEFIENSSRKKLNIELQDHIGILWKAMAETEACTRIGAILGDGSDEEVQALAEFGRRIGFASRIVDEVKDSLNIEGSLVHRLKYESVPLPLLFAAKSSENRRLKIKEILKTNDYPPSTIRNILEIYFESDAYNYMDNIFNKNMDATANCMKVLRHSFSKHVLLSLNQKFHDEINALRF